MSFVPGQRVGSYEIIGPLGAGGMGRVYRARDLQLGRDVAIKVIADEASQRPDAVRRLLAEARAASALAHPNILVVHAVGEIDGTPYLVTELVDGVTLRAMLQDGPLPLELVADIARQMAAGLDKAHGAGLVHRDLKPENVMRTHDGIVKILDFGLVKRSGIAPDGAASLGLDPTATGLVVGTAAYMSPEQARGSGADLRSDLFSFGAVLYELMAGQSPFRRSTLADTITSVLRDEPRPVTELRPDVPAPVATLVHRMLAKDPDTRPGSARDLATALASAGFGSAPGFSGTARPSGFSAARTPDVRRRRARIAALVAIAAALAAAVAVGLRDRTPAGGPEPAAAALFAPGPVVAVMAIDDKTADPELVQAGVGRMLSDAFVQILHDCRGVQVVSPVRIHSLVMGDKRTFIDTAHDFDLVNRVCTRAGANTIFAGALSRLGSTFVLDATLTDLASGRLLGSFRAQAAGKDSLLETLTTALGGDMRRTLASEGGIEIAGGRHLSAITTPSFEAYAHYARGTDLNNAGAFESAVPELEKAVEIDPLMGIAWNELSCAYSFLGQEDRARAASQRALSLLDRMSRKEVLWTKASALWVEGASGDRYRAAIGEFLDEFPDDRQGRFYIGLAYQWLDHDCAAATREFEKAFALTPEYYPITKGIADCAVEAGDKSSAIARLQRYVSAHAASPSADQARGYIAALRGARS